jgi:S1-C subfamily serine protease
MRWFRDTRRQGAWLAQIALAMNLGLSFGHIHAIDGKVSGHRLVTVAAIASPGHGQNQGHHDDGQADYLCPICMAANAIASALASTPPALPAEFVNVTIDRTIVSTLALVEPQRAAFRPRGPPIS